MKVTHAFLLLTLLSVVSCSSLTRIEFYSDSTCTTLKQTLYIKNEQCGVSANYGSTILSKGCEGKKVLIAPVCGQRSCNCRGYSVFDVNQCYRSPFLMNNGPYWIKPKACVDKIPELKPHEWKTTTSLGTNTCDKPNAVFVNHGKCRAFGENSIRQYCENGVLKQVRFKDAKCQTVDVVYNVSERCQFHLGASSISQCPKKFVNFSK